MGICRTAAYKVGHKNTKKSVAEQKKSAKISLFASILLISQSKTKKQTIHHIMEIEGKIIAVLPPREGVSARTGTAWKTQDYVIETHEQYPRKCCFNVFGSDKIQLFNIQVGEELRVSFDIDAHEYQGRWFNSVRAWKVERIDPSMAQQPMAPAAPFAQPVSQMEAPAGQQGPVADTAPFPPQSEGGSEDDLPF